MSLNRPTWWLRYSRRPFQVVSRQELVDSGPEGLERLRAHVSGVFYSGAYAAVLELWEDPQRNCLVLYLTYNPATWTRRSDHALLDL